jgi:hypothetical protein
MSGPAAILGFDYQLYATVYLIFEFILNNRFMSADIEVRFFDRITNKDIYDIDLAIHSINNGVNEIKLFAMKSGKYNINDINSAFDCAMEGYKKKGFKEENVSPYLVIPGKQIKSSLYKYKVLFLGKHINDRFFPNQTEVEKSHLQFEIAYTLQKILRKLEPKTNHDYFGIIDLSSHYAAIIHAKICKHAQDINLNNYYNQNWQETKVTLTLEDILCIEGGISDYLFKITGNQFSSIKDACSNIKAVLSGMKLKTSGIDTTGDQYEIN